jgi:hypothetical protein
MTTYQQMEHKDMAMRAQCPSEVADILTKLECASVSGHQSRGDFILEAKNGRTKMWILPGVPSEAKWLRCCRNLDKLDKVCRITVTIKKTIKL